MQWEGKIGPAAILGGIGIVITICSALIGFGILEGTIKSSERDVADLRGIATQHTERLARIEGKLEILMTSAPGKRVEFSPQ